MSDLKCPYCGANILYNPKDQSVECPYCSSKFNPSEIKESETVKEDNEIVKEGKTYKEYSCTSCGASLIAEKDTSAFLCPYCGGTLITAGLSGNFQPEGIIPFKITKEEFRKKYEKYTRKILVPSAFKKISDFDKQEGVYLPYNLYDSEAKGYFYFRCEEDKEETHRDSDGETHTETKTETSYEYAMAHITVKNLSIGATTKIDHKHTDSVQPYDFSEIKEFSPSYIAGFTAERKNNDEASLDSEAEERIRKSLVNEADPSNYEFYDRAYAEEEAYDFLSMKKSYALLPAWTCHVKYKNKDYLYLCNGQTGKMGGSLPVSPLKCILLFMSIYLGILLIPLIFFFIYSEPLILIIPAVMGILPSSIVMVINIVRTKSFKSITANSSMDFHCHNELSEREIRDILKNRGH